MSGHVADPLDAIKGRLGASTPGPWGWRGQIDGSIELRTLHSGGLRIISTARSEPCVIELPSDDIYGHWVLTANACDGCKAEAAKTMDPWLDYRCQKSENLDTVWLWDPIGFIEPSNQWAERERPYRNDVARVAHPDAEFIAHAPEDVAWLLSQIEQLRADIDDRRRHQAANRAA